ncbi:hypothetical protein [Prosthecobacter sp.]|uniref:hypothetical protein n=1 Tax=Prosthecobacter sp. TaxID=1965333 RepID=UPI00378508B5
MKPGLLSLILTLASAGWGWSEDWEAWSMRLMQFWGLHWTHDIPWIADPVPSLLQVATQASEERPVPLEELDGSLHEPSGFTILYITGFYQFSDWEIDNNAWFQTEDFPDFFPIIDWPKPKYAGAYWIRPHKCGPWKLPAFASKPAKKSGPMPAWLKGHPVPSDLRTSLPDRLLLYPPLPYQSPFDVSRYFVPSELLKPLPPP